MSNKDWQDDMTPKTQKEKNSDKDRLVGAAAGGAILGASLGGPFGAVLGGIAGLVLGDKVNKSKEGGDNG